MLLTLAASAAAAPVAPTVPPRAMATAVAFTAVNAQLFDMNLFVI
jgi:hypothetical protein